MSQTDASGFGQFVPGFDFLKSLGQGRAAMPGLDHWNKWVAPTLDPEALDKRIEELKVVQFWLEQNATALKATIQALEVQKMTVATLRGMNLNTADLARVFQAAQPGGTPAVAEPTAPTSPKAAENDTPKSTSKAKASAKTRAGATPAAPDPVQFWGALTQQFQQIASQALQDVTNQAANMPSAQATSPAAAPAAKRPAPSRPAAKRARSTTTRRR